MGDSHSRKLACRNWCFSRLIFITKNDFFKMVKIEIRKAVSEDYLLVSDLGSKSFYETWRPVNSEEDIQNYIKEAFNPLNIKADIEAGSTNTFFIAIEENKPVGYVKLRNDRTHEEFKDEKAIELERLYVLQEWQEKKVGKALMDEGLKMAVDQHYNWMWLGVATENLKALKFYKQYGFIIFGEKIFKLGDALDTDYLMKKNLVE